MGKKFGRELVEMLVSHSHLIVEILSTRSKFERVSSLARSVTDVSEPVTELRLKEKNQHKSKIVQQNICFC